jgi:6-phosphogluconolactonase
MPWLAAQSGGHDVVSSVAYVASAASDSVGGLFSIDLTTESSTLVSQTGPLVALGLHPTKPLLYGLEEGKPDTLLTWQIENGWPRLVDRCALPGKGALALEVVGDNLVIAHFWSSQVSTIHLDAEGLPGKRRTVTLLGDGPEKEVQDTAHPHHVLDVDGIAVVTDLGADALWMLDPADLTIQRVIDLPPGSGPRHSAVLPDGRLAVTGELDVTLMIVDLAGGISSSPTSRALQEARTYPSDLAVHSSGYIFVANRNVGTIGSLDIRNDGPHLLDEYPSGGTWPLNMAIGGGILAVAQRDSDRVSLLTVDSSDGSLALITSIPVPRPTWVQFSPQATHGKATA